MNQVKAFLGSAAFHSFYHAVLAGATGFLATNGFNPSKAWISGLVAAVLGGVIGWLNGNDPVPATPSTGAQGQKITAWILGFFLLASVGSANPLQALAQPPSTGEDIFVLAPIGAVEFNPSSPNNYGLAVAESIGFVNVLPGADSKHVVVSPYGFVGFFGAANIGQWVASNGNAPWSIDYGIMVGLPKLDQSIPEVAFSATWNSIQRGDAKLMINVAFPADILPSILVHPL